MTTPLSTLARRAVRLTREALERDAKQAMATLAHPAAGTSIDETFVALDRRLRALPPKKRYADISARMLKLDGLQSVCGVLLHASKQLALAIVIIPDVGRHPFTGITEASISLVALQMTLRRHGWRFLKSAPASVTEHLIGRIHERGGLDIEETCRLIARAALASVRAPIEPADEGREIHLAVGNLVLAGTVRAAIGKGARGFVEVAFVDYRTALTRDMCAPEVLLRADTLAAACDDVRRPG